MTPLGLLLPCLAAVLLCVGCTSPGRPGAGKSGETVLQTPADGHARAALRLLEKGDWNSAVSRATVAVAMDPENAALHLLLASAHHRGFREGQKAQGDLAEAGYRVAVNLDPDNGAALRNLGSLYLDQQRYRSAQAALSRAVQVDDSDGGAFHALAVAAYYGKDLATALWAIRKSAQMLPQDPGVLRGAAVIHAAFNLPVEARAYSERLAAAQTDAGELESLKKTLERWRRQNAKLLAQADAVVPAAAEQLPSAPPPSTAAGAVQADGIPQTVESSGKPIGAPGVEPETLDGRSQVQHSPDGEAPVVGVPPQEGQNNGTVSVPQGQPEPPPVGAAGAGAPAPDVLVRDWRDCKQHFSDYDFRDDGDAGGMAAGMATSTGSGYSGATASTDETQALRALPSPCRGLPLPRMVMVDAVILTTVEDSQFGNGLNLLDSLSIVLNGSREVTRALAADGTWSTTEERRRSAALGNTTAGVTYSLNIANATRNRVEVLARPTLMALDRKASTFFSGSDVTVPVSGTYGGSLQDKQVGTSLSVTPTLLDDDSMLLSAKAARSFFEPTVPGSINELLVTARNMVMANVRIRFGQSLILSGLRERENADGHGGVPGLKDTPGLQYLFSRRNTHNNEKNVLIVITPRRVEGFQDVLASAGSLKDVPDPAFRKDEARVKDQAARDDEVLPPNIRMIMQGQLQNHLMRDHLIQRGDLGLPRVQSQRRFDHMLEDLKRFIYF